VRIRSAAITAIPDLPIPAGAIAGDCYDIGGCDHPADISRTLTWSLHDVDEVRVTVAGAQYADGRVDRYVLLHPDRRDVELTAAGAHQRAAALLNAADSLDALI
jgi:hypothetical protein